MTKSDEDLLRETQSLDDAYAAAEAWEKQHSYEVWLTEDGYTFYELPDGRVVDSLDPAQVDQQFQSVAELKWYVDVEVAVQK